LLVQYRRITTINAELAETAEKILDVCSAGSAGSALYVVCGRYRWSCGTSTTTELVAVVPTVSVTVTTTV
jgi:hypothetical protein